MHAFCGTLFVVVSAALLVWSVLRVSGFEVELSDLACTPVKVLCQHV